jgi:nucleoside-diphosphate-sugar epimerase
MRVLLTGATGFIGAHVTQQLLEQGDDVHIVVEPDAPLGRLEGATVTVHHGNLLDRERMHTVVAAASPEVCIHLAWYAVPGKYLHAEENIPLTFASVELAKILAAHGCKRFVGAGTCIEYDTSHGTLRVDSTPIAPQTLYGVCKVALWGMLRELETRLGMEMTWLRFFFLYGPTEAPGRLVSDVLGKLSRREKVQTTRGEQVRDFLHVVDVAQAVALVAKSSHRGPINIGSGVAVRVCDVVTAMEEASGARGLVELGAMPSRPGDPPYICAETTPLRALGFIPRFDLRSGLIDTVRWMKEVESV